MGLTLWGLLVATLGLLWYWRKSRSSRAKERGLKEFPGPKGLPILGNVLDLGSYADKQFNKWSDEYGSMYQVKLGPNTYVKFKLDNSPNVISFFLEME